MGRPAPRKTSGIIPARCHSYLEQYRPWTGADTVRLLDLRDRVGLDWPDIADEINRNATDCYRRYRDLKKAAGEETIHHSRDNKHLLADRLADRDRRHMVDMDDRERHLQSGDLTPIMCGDPPRGRSALEKKLARA